MSANSDPHSLEAQRERTDKAVGEMRRLRDNPSSKDSWDVAVAEAWVALEAAIGEEFGI